MAGPAFLFTVDRQMNLDVGILFPFIDDLLIFDQIVLGTGAVNDLNRAVSVGVLTFFVAAVVDDRTDRCKTDTASDDQQVFALEVGVNGEAVAVRPADGDLLTRLPSNGASW